MPTRKRLSLDGPAMAFITTSIHNWIPVFKSKEFAQCVLEQLKETCDHYQVSIAGYVIMPTHIHFLAGFKDLNAMSKTMQSFKILSSKKLKDMLPAETKRKFMFDGSFRMWQDRFDDVIIWSEKQFKIKMEYIHNNSVKAGLVTTAVDYKYSSAIDWLLNRNGSIPIDKNWSWTK